MKVIEGKYWLALGGLAVCLLALVYSLLMIPTSAGVMHYNGLAGPQVQNTSTPLAAGTDLADVLLLVDSRQPQIAEAGFTRLVKFYGVTLATIDLSKTELTDSLLHDEAGAYYRAVFVTANNLSPDLTTSELNVLKAAMERGGTNVMIGQLHLENSPAVQTLTAGEIKGSSRSRGAKIAYHVSSAWPEITRELSGIDVSSKNTQPVYALTIAPHTPSIETLIDGSDDSGGAFATFALYKSGQGALFVSGDNPDPVLSDSPLASNLYAVNQPSHVYQADRFSQIAPVMMFLRYALGDEVWHQDHNYANFTLDDPPLNQTKFNYAGIEKEAEIHNFHFTLAMPPVFYTRTEEIAVKAFLDHPDRMSVVQHGNTHDGYEFYRYVTDAADQRPAEPKEMQEASIVEGLTRMEAFTRITGIPFAQTMIFPENIAPAETLTLLKEYNYQATINSQDFPLDGQRTANWDSYMYPAELSYNNLALFGRSAPKNEPYPFTLFLGQPVLLYAHKDFFNPGINSFSPVADYINGLKANVEWKSLDYIMKHLYMEKSNDDGVIDVRFYTNEVIITNEKKGVQTYRIQREETQIVPMASVTIDGTPVDYDDKDGKLIVQTTIAPGASKDVQIHYAPPDRDFSLTNADISYDAKNGVVSAKVHNLGGQPGPVTLGFFSGPADTTAPMTLNTAIRVDPSSTSLVTATLSVTDTASLKGSITVVADPYNVIPETNETNNTATVDVKTSGGDSTLAAKP
ncbi:MAG: CARDB domain-containing protein [Chloroflexota bacterium]